MGTVISFLRSMTKSLLVPVEASCNPERNENDWEGTLVFSFRISISLRKSASTIELVE